MIVTCESCKSRYKLDDSKVTGRGAKITCPRCKFVFVVYARPGGDAAPPPEPPRPAAPERPPAPAAPSRPSWDDDEPTRIGMTAPPPGTTAPPSGGPGPSVSPTSAAPPVAPAPTPATAVVPNPALAAPSTHEVVRENTNEDRAKLSGSRPINAMAARAAQLDFRKVGVTTWKVKVRIGLVYDFSDTKTLRKYIQDGRVTSADVISYDGKTWKPLGEIPDLDAFFVETWERLEAALAEAPPEPPKETAKEPPRDPPRERQSTAELAGPAITPPGIGQDPFAIRRSTGRTQAVTAPQPPPPKPDASGPRNALLVVVVLALAVVGIAWWVTSHPTETPAGTAPNPAAGDAAAAAYMKKVNDKIEQDIRNNPAAPLPSGDAADATTHPVVPPPGAGMPPGATSPSPANDPTLKPIKPAGAGAGASASPSGNREQTAADHMAIGDSAASQGRWADAAKAYQNAANLDPKSASIHEKLGEAQYKAGSKDAAQATLQQALKLGAKEAAKYLGHIAREQGDNAGATGYYQQYLKGSPPDKADIERIIHEMSGG